MIRRYVTVALASVVLAPGVSAQDPASFVPQPAPTLASWAPLQSAGSAVAIDERSVEAFFDAAFDVQRQERALVGATVSVVYRGAVLFKKGYGFADLENRIPVDADETLFRIGSISKPFTWTALMQLAERGVVDLEAPLADHVDFPLPETFGEPLRPVHLLSHTPGFEEGYTGFIARSADEVLPLGEALADLVPGQVNPPGRFASYSNYGSALAGYVVERASGVAWADYIEQRVLAPLGMHRTNVRTELSDAHRRAHAKGYTQFQGELVETPWAYLNLEPAGSISSTAGDMARFMLAHLNLGALDGERILREETARQMREPLFSSDAELPPILYGFYRSDRGGQEVFGHGGDVNQFHSNMALLPQHELGVFVSYNSDPGAVTRSSVVAGFIDHFFPSAHLPEPPRGEEVDPAPYMGEYVPLRSNFTGFEKLRTLFAGGTQLHSGDGSVLRFANGMPLVPLGEHRFVGRYGGPLIVFESDDAGRVTHMIAGSPLGSFVRVRGLDRPSVQAHIVNFAFWIAVLGAMGWLVGLLHRVPAGDRLPGLHRAVAGVQGVTFAALLTALQLLSNNAVFGIDASLHAVTWGLNANLGLGLLVVVFAADQWWRRSGTGLRRAAYSAVALGALAQAWFVVTFNLLGGL